MITPDGVALAIGAVLLAYGWGFWHGRRRQRATENEGEGAVRSALTLAFSGPAFHLMNNLTLPDGDGTTQIDHVLITRTGIFVIEAKHYKGVIEAHASAATWSFHYGPRTYVRQNPLRQNYRHVKAVERLLGARRDTAGNRHPPTARWPCSGASGGASSGGATATCGAEGRRASTGGAPSACPAIIAPTGGEHMQMGMVLAITPMGVEHGDVAPLKRLPPHGTVEVIQTWCPAAHERLNTTAACW